MYEETQGDKRMRRIAKVYEMASEEYLQLL